MWINAIEQNTRTLCIPKNGLNEILLV